MRCKETIAYLAAKNHSRQRGIEFKFTFEQWRRWWLKQLGPNWMQLRGCKSGQFVMARKRDHGAYEPRNVCCILANENHKDRVANGTSAYGERHGRAKLTEAKVLKIRQSKKTSVELASVYAVSPITIRDIRARRRWRYL